MKCLPVRHRVTPPPHYCRLTLFGSVLVYSEWPGPMRHARHAACEQDYSGPSKTQIQFSQSFPYDSEILFCDEWKVFKVVRASVGYSVFPTVSE